MHTCTSVCPTFGGSDPGIRAEFVHSLKEELNVMCGFSCSRHPSAFTALSVSAPALLIHIISCFFNWSARLIVNWRPRMVLWQLGRSKWNGQVGSSGLVITLETPIDNMARPSLSIQLNGGFEFWRVTLSLRALGTSVYICFREGDTTVCLYILHHFRSHVAALQYI